MTTRNVIQIDEEKCDGCGLCVPSCEEGAIQIIQGKARVVSESYCDGLGACLGHCPRDAISIVQREAAPFDERAVAEHMAALRAAAYSLPAKSCSSGSGCPGTAPQQFGPSEQPESAPAPARTSRLTNWPVQLHLVSPQSPWLHQADLLLVADCVPLACADFHGRILDGRPVVMGCPKLDDCHVYISKLATILQQAHVRSISVVHMEVPCCTGLIRVAEAAVRQAGVQVPLYDTVVTTRGEIMDRRCASSLSDSTRDATSSSVQLPIL